MKQKRKRFAAWLLCVALVLALLPAVAAAEEDEALVTRTDVPAAEAVAPEEELPAAEEEEAPVLGVPAPLGTVVDSGDCGAQGNNLTWTLESNGTLTVTGTGAMADYALSSGKSSAPWTGKTVTKAVLGSGVTSVGNRAFQNCATIAEVELPQTLETIGLCAFTNCTALSSVTLPGSVETIGISAFAGSGLTEITIPNSVTQLSRSAFSRCQSLESAILGDGITALDNMLFANCTSLTSVSIGSSVTKIGGLLEPENNNMMGGQTFSGCSALEKLTIPSSVQSVNWYAFEKCTNLTSITFEGADAPQISTNVFKNGTSAVSIYYPVGDADWDSLASKNYGCTVTWCPYGPGCLTGGAAPDVQDMACLFKYLSTNAIESQSLSGNEPLFREMADVNGDDAVDILDYQMLYMMILDPAS